MSNVAKSIAKSSWTPLSREETNHKIFEERRALIGKWFDKWTDEQRKQVIADLVGKCKKKQLEYAGEIINEKRPIHKGDFTRQLPRVVSLYVLSFLDPRSLSRCSQVCWYWKYITELDQLWMTKCLRLGWVLSFSPSPYESGVWKRLYIENIMALKVMAPKRQHSDVHLRDIDSLSIASESTRKSTSRSLKPGSGKSKLPPWRGTDPNPKDMWRNNILDNNDDRDKVDKMRRKHLYGPMAEEIMRKAKNKVRTGEHAALIKAIHTEQQQVGGRPQWASGESGAPFMSRAQIEDASVRPAPVAVMTKPPRPSSSRPASRPKTDYGDPNTSPWRRPSHDDDSDT